MYERMAKCITDFFVKRDFINAEDREVYVYSFEVLISDLFYIAFALLTALVSKSLIETVAFILGFFSIRRFAGGYHADSYIRCHIMFWLNQVIMIILAYITPRDKMEILTLILYITSVVLVFLFAPVGNENRPFTESEQKRFRLLSRITIILIALVMVGLRLFNIDSRYIFVCIFGVFSVSASLIAERIKISKKKEVGKLEQISKID